MKARLVICGNFEDVSREDVRCDAPTADAESHCLLAWHPIHRSHPDGSTGQASPLTPSCQLSSLLNPCAGRNLYLHQLNHRWEPCRANTLLQARPGHQVHRSVAA